MEFHDKSTAANANITNTGLGGIIFSESSAAGHATINNISGFTDFEGTSNAGTATINVLNNSDIRFFDSSSAASSVITIFGNSAQCIVSGGEHCSVAFFGGEQTTAANALINNSGVVYLFGSAGSANITNSSLIIFGNSSYGSFATIDKTEALPCWDPVALIL